MRISPCVLATPQVKNRFCSGAAPGGYMDVNVNVLFRGLVCEIQAGFKNARGAENHL